MPYVYKLKAAPARLYVHNPQNADIIIDGNFAGNAVDSIKLPIVIEMKEGKIKRKLKVQLFKDTFKPWETSLELKAGEEKRLNIDLESAK